MKRLWLPLAAIVVILLLAITGQRFPSPSSDSSIPPAQTGTVTPLSEPELIAAEALPTTDRPPEPSVLLFPDAEVVSSREILLPDNRLRRTRLLRIRDQRSPVRTEEIWSLDDSDTPLHSIEQHAMLADQILLEVHDADLPTLRRLAEKNGFTPRNGEWKTGFLVLELNRTTLEAVPEAISLFSQAFGETIVAEPDYLYFPCLTSNDPKLWEQSGLDTIEASAAWDFSTGSSDAVVAVIDSGALMSHPDLVDNLSEHAWDFVDNSNYPNDDEGHGTHISGIIGATGNNGIGIAGVNWETGVLPLRVGDGTFSTSLIIDALHYVIDLKVNQGVNIVATNNSYGAPSTTNSLLKAIKETQDAGILFIAAAGNDSQNLHTTPTYPASYSTGNIISVAATTSSDSLASFSNYGKSRVHLAAPGVSILSTYSDGLYKLENGTSMAAPFVAGAAALIAAAAPELTWQEIKKIILKSSDPVPALQSKTLTGGRLNLRRAVTYAVTGVPQLEVLSPSAPFVRLTDNQMSLFLQAAVVGHPEVPVSWQLVQGPAVQFSPSPEGGTFGTFSGEGDFILQARAELNSVVLTEQIAIRIDPDNIFTHNLTGYWKMDDATGNTATDSSGSHSHGLLHGNTSWTPGEIDGALDFDGTNSSVTFQQNSPASVTLSAWVYSDSPGQSIFPRILDGPEYLLFFGRDVTESDPANQETIKFVAKKSSSNPDGVWYSSPFSIRDGEWFHIAVTYNALSAANIPRIYLNGETQPVSAQVEPLGSRQSSGTSWTVGNSAAMDRPWDGQLDEIRIYDRELSPIEIRAIANKSTNAQGPAATFESPDSVTTGTPVPFSANFSGNWSVGSSATWTQLSGPTTADISNPFETAMTATFPETGDYLLLFETEKEGIRLSRQFSISAEAPQQLTLSANRVQTIRNPSFPIRIILTAAHPVQSPITVNLHQSGDAVPGIDFEALPPSLSIPAGDTSAEVFLTPLANNLLESVTLEIQLSPTAPSPVSPEILELTISPYLFTNWQNYYSDLSGEMAPLADSTGDGLSNLLRYALGIPADRSIQRPHPNLPFAAIATEAANPHLTLTYRRPTGLTDLLYLTEAHDPATGTWEEFTGQQEVEPLDEGLEQVTLHDPIPLSAAPSRLIRLNVRLLDSVD